MLRYDLGKNSRIESYTLFNRPICKKLPYTVTAFGDYNCSPDFFVERTDLASCLLFFTLEGSGFLRYGGKEFILPKNHAKVINCREYQYYAPLPGENWRFYWIHFDGKCAADITEILNGWEEPTLDMTHRPDFYHYYRKLSVLEKSTDKNRELFLSDLINEMLSELLLYGQMDIPEKRYAEHLPNIEKTVAYITENYSKNITISQLAERCNLSKFYFIKIFECVMGYTPYTFLTLYRLKQAKKLLLESRHTVNEISVMVGFSDAKGFISSFKKYVGISPLQFRKSRQI